MHFPLHKISIFDAKYETRRTLFNALSYIVIFVMLLITFCSYFVFETPYISILSFGFAFFLFINTISLSKILPLEICLQFIFGVSFLNLFTCSLLLGGVYDPGLCWHLFFLEVAIPFMTTRASLIWAATLLLVYPMMDLLYKTPIALYQIAMTEKQWETTFHVNFYLFITASAIVLYVFNGAIRRSYEEAKNSKEYLTELVRIIGHDINNPLTVINGLHEVVSESLTASPDQEKKLGLIKKETDSIRKIIEKVRIWKALESGKEKISIEIVPVAQAIRYAVESEKERFQNKKINLVINTIPQDLAILADLEVLSFKILREIINNAIKYSFPKSTVTISIIHDLRTVTVEIKDEGIGIPQKEIPFITSFDSKYLKVGTGSEKGSGLSLPLANILLQKMNGKLQIQSQVFATKAEHGSKFSITLPKAVA